jgi:hypothetical protein
MSAELEVLQDALARLEREGIPYMLTGSLALSYYAEPRMTRDIDLVVDLFAADSKRLVALFEPEYYVSAADAERALRERGMFNLLHLDNLVKVEFIVRKDEPFRLNEFERRKRVRLAGFDAWIATREDLILSKLAWAKPSGSELQLRDVRALLAGGADVGYLRRWGADLGVAGLLEKCLE